MQKISKNNDIIMILGLGYVGLPLSLELSKFFKVIGFDTDKQRIKDLRRGFDKTNEVTKKNLLTKVNLELTFNYLNYDYCNVFIITVPTPVNKRNEPDLKNLKKAASSVAKIINKGSIVVIESTVYPGVTEDIIAPIIESKSGLKVFFNERINLNDKSSRLSDS